MSTLIVCAIFGIPISILIMCMIIALGKRPGLRRRAVQVFEGLERRCEERQQCTYGKVCTTADKCLYLNSDGSSNPELRSVILMAVNTESKTRNTDVNSPRPPVAE